MQVSTFFGCFSLKTGTLIIGILHVICPPFLFYYVDVPHFWGQYLASFTALIVCFALMLIVGVVTENVENVFPFVSTYFVTIIMLVYYIGDRLIRNYSLMCRQKDEAFIMLCDIFGFALMYYFFFIAYNFYQKLLLKKFRVLLSTDSIVENNRIPYNHGILNNFTPYQTKEKKSNEEVLI